MTTKTTLTRLFAALFAIHCSLFTAQAQGWPENYGGVMLQGFYWDSYDDSQWTVLEKQADDFCSTFDLVWIPQSGNCVGKSMGYDDLYWFENYNSSFGNEAELRQMIKTFKAKGIGTIADVVINHRRNVSTWTDFPKETYNGVTYQLTYEDIVADDEAAKNGHQVGPNKDTGEGWPGMRDLDHKSENVQKSVKAYLDFLLNDLGYTGFRYDMVKGYAAEYTKMYNQEAKPQFSVGECWDSSNTIKKWIDGTGKTSAAFDFQFRYTVRNAINKNDWSQLAKQNEGNWPLVSKDYEQGNYRRWAVTFVENHDTEKRSNAGQDPIKKDTLAANAYLLAMPGTPCVFLTHWQAYKQEIKAMILARKIAGITNMSSYTNMRSNKDYYANVIKTGDENRLLVIVGNNTNGYVPSANDWQEVLSGYKYKYYLAKKLNTPFTDRAAGVFTEPFDVTLTAVTDQAGYKLVYTTDGSEPSGTNGTEVASGTKLHIDKTTTLTVALITAAGSSVLRNTYTYEEPEVLPKAECTYNEGEVCAFFEAPASWTKTIYCWAWTDSPSDNFTFANGGWPGVSCELLGVADNGNKVWKWTWDGTKEKNSSATKPAKIIFSNNGTPQTADLIFTQGGYYNEKGLQRTITPTGITKGVRNYVQETAIYDLQGRRVVKPTKPGVYISGGKKFVAK